MNREISVVIDQEKCTGCGLCLDVCPDHTLSLEDGRATVTGERCLECGHCHAVCPPGAIEVEAISPESLNFNTFRVEKRWLKWGDFNTAELVRLMASRRSCRNFLDKPVSRGTLEDLVKIGTTAPSGTNSQKWTFTVLEQRDQVEKFGERIGLFFRKLNKTAANPLYRFLSKLSGRDELGKYYSHYYDSVRAALDLKDKEGRDLLFHGAPAVIVIGSKEGAAGCPAEDALLAGQNILLGAHALGLGTCLIGFAVSAIKHDPSIMDILSTPRHERIHVVIALGYPAETYQRLTGRRHLKPHFPKITE